MSALKINQSYKQFSTFFGDRFRVRTLHFSASRRGLFINVVKI